MDRDRFEELVGQPVTDEQWQQIVADVNGRIDNFADALWEDIVDEFGEWA